jgi:hypothetical protein
MPETPRHLRMASAFYAQVALRSVAVYGEVSFAYAKIRDRTQFFRNEMLS